MFSIKKLPNMFFVFYFWNKFSKKKKSLLFKKITKCLFKSLKNIFVFLRTKKVSKNSSQAYSIFFLSNKDFFYFILYF